MVSVADGKYRLVMGDDGVLTALRDNMSWPGRDLAGDDLVLALAQELREAREELSLLERKVAHGCTDTGCALCDKEGA
jgi:hypothetical protein